MAESCGSSPCLGASWILESREDVLEQLAIEHGFLSGLFTPLGCAAYGNRVCRQRQLRVCRQRQLRATVNRGPYGGDFHHHMIIFV